MDLVSCASHLTSLPHCCHCQSRCGNPHRDTLKVWDVVREAAEEGGVQLVHVATAYTDDDEAQVADMAVSEGMLATIWRFFSVSQLAHA